MYILYGTDVCRFCKMAKELLDRHSIKYVYHDISERKKEILDDLANATGNQRSMPVIFNEAIFIGGYTDLEYILCFDIDEEF
jgi:glutaredoxin